MSGAKGAVVDLQYNVLRFISPREPNVCSGEAFAGRSKLDLLGNPLDVAGKTVIDFGCGEGHECVELAQRGARKVIGVDIRSELLERARELAIRHGVAETCKFAQRTQEKADMVISLDAFEHFDNPAEILSLMEGLLKPGGSIRVSFGPTWYHPLGGHLFSVFPWAHLVFSETALIRWRSDFKGDGATRFHEVAGGLNCMTIRRFERLVEGSSLKANWFECVPIRRLRRLHNSATREFTTSIVRCELVRRHEAVSLSRAS
jgi:SAM-dependent methyltransferase